MVQPEHIRLARKPPEGWERLGGDAHHFGIADLIRYSGMQIMRNLDSLSDDALEETAYFGLALGSLAMARLLALPHQYQKTVTTLAEALQADGLSMREIIHSDNEQLVGEALVTSQRAFKPLAEAAYRTLGRADQNRSELSAQVMQARRRNIPIIQPGTERDITDEFLQRVSDTHAASSLLAANALPASIAVHRFAHQLHVPQATDGMHRALRNASVQAARLHSEEFADPLLMERLIGLGPDGLIQFNREAVPASPHIPERPNTLVRHTERLRCPAADVNGFIGRMLTVIPAVILAQEQAS